ncbi:uncharacterized protein LOC115667981 [Syzygium oleosum]|uniref:uncharacterized protein LOC115667981 n=1 Tax=Syzygium oleosum TaxID=219896 RepID=UPI0024B8F6C8|nr:uncharacterized protein LOC115667981 [Syzygium oleosum]
MRNFSYCSPSLLASRPPTAHRRPLTCHRLLPSSSPVPPWASGHHLPPLTALLPSLPIMGRRSPSVGHRLRPPATSRCRPPPTAFHCGPPPVVCQPPSPGASHLPPIALLPPLPSYRRRPPPAAGRRLSPTAARCRPPPAIVLRTGQVAVCCRLQPSSSALAKSPSAVASPHRSLPAIRCHRLSSSRCHPPPAVGRHPPLAVARHQVPPDAVLHSGCVTVCRRLPPPSTACRSLPLSALLLLSPPPTDAQRRSPLAAVLRTGYVVARRRPPFAATICLPTFQIAVGVFGVEGYTYRLDILQLMVANAGNSDRTAISSLAAPPVANAGNNSCYLDTR